MKRIINLVLVAALLGCFVWAAIAPGMQDLIPTILAIIIGEILLSRKTTFIRYY